MEKELPRKRKKLRGEGFTVLPLYLFTLLFIVGPLVYMIVLSFMSRAETWGVVPEFTLKNYQDILDPVYLETFWESIKLAVVSTVLVIADDPLLDQFPHPAVRMDHHFPGRGRVR